MTRKSLSVGVARQLERYFDGKRCVVTGGNNAEYHHLDDDSANTTFVNLIPLSSSFNSPNLRDARTMARRMLFPTLRSELDPHNLLLRANLHFAGWETALAYGCSRLAYYIASNYLAMDAENRLPMACSAMYFARHSMNYDLIYDILLRDFLPTAREAKLRGQTRALAIQELAGILSEHGRYKDALQMYDLIPETLSSTMASGDPRRYAGLLRRKAMSTIAQRGITNEAHSLLWDAKLASPKDDNINASVANTLAWHYLSEGEFGKAADLLEPLNERFGRSIFTPGSKIIPINVTAWNAAGIFHSYGVALGGLNGRQSDAGRKAIGRAAVIYEKSGSRPFLLRERFWDQEVLRANGDSHSTAIKLSRLPSRIDVLIKEMTGILNKK